MSAGFEIKKFFRKMDAALIQRYFKEKHDIVFCQEEQKKKAAELDAQWNAWLALPEKIRIQAESDFIQIDELSNERGITAILDEAEYHDKKQLLLEEWEDKPIGARVFLAFLDHWRFWKGAVRFYEADKLPVGSWRKRKNIPPIGADVSERAVLSLEQNLGQYFFEQTGKGKNCKIEVYRRQNRDYFFAYPEDYARESQEWVGNTLTSRSAKRAYSVIFLYIKEEGTLSIYCKGIGNRLKDLQDRFASAILHCDTLPDNAKDNRIYDLSPLSDRAFVFKIPPDSPVRQVSISKLRVSQRYLKEFRIMIEAPNWFKNPQGIYDLLEDIRKLPQMRDCEITQAEMKAIVVDDEGKDITRTISITWPNSCSLQSEGRDALLMDILIQSGIELKEQIHGETPKEGSQTA